MKILVLDNYDSFTWNLVHLVEKVSEFPIDVFQNDRISVKDAGRYDKILLSPGPGLPSESGIMPQLLERYHNTKSIFGVCLGMQAIGEMFGSPLKNLDTVCHGVATTIRITEQHEIFKDCPPEFKAGRYHSWVIDEKKISKDLLVTAVDEKGRVMAIKHRALPISGVQFHPESILSEHGETIIKNWIYN